MRSLDLPRSAAATPSVFVACGCINIHFTNSSSERSPKMKLRVPLLVFLSPLLAVGMMYGQQEKPSVPPDEPSTPEVIKQFNNDKVAELSKEIAGKEDQPAEVVFKNIKILTGVPAGNLLKIMQMGYDRALGTSCAHCHVPGQWDKDDKRPKQIARDMATMSHNIIFDLLRNIDGIKDREPRVNCTTCHRGQLKPALDMDADGTKK
jgi:hypothetical protein